MTGMTEEELDRALEPLRRALSRRETVTVDRTMSFTTKNNSKTEVHFMASFDFENLKQKLSDTASTVAAKTTEFAKDVAGKSTDAARALSGKAQTAARKAKLNMEMASERSALKERYNELGRLYYEKYAGNTDPDFADTVTALEELLEKIEAKQAEIDALSAEPAEPEIEVEVEETSAEPDHIVDEVENTVEAEAEAAADMAEEAAEEARRTYEETVDTVGGQQL